MSKQIEYSFQNFVLNYVMLIGQIGKTSDQKEDLKGQMSCYGRTIMPSTVSARTRKGTFIYLTTSHHVHVT